MNFKFTGDDNPWNFKANFGIKLLSKKGLLTYEYNPLKVLRYEEDLTLIDKLGNTLTVYKNELADLDTEKFNFDLNHPVLIEAQLSYDGSVNLILNDNKNIPRMINTRFSVTGNNLYEVVERTVDSNIYDYETFDTLTSLYKRVSTIPKIEFIGIKDNGNLKIGNYTFYFKLSDGDGNETDWIGQSGIVSCHIGNINDPFSIRGGMENENSYKLVEFKLTNIDPAYVYVAVYYSRVTSSLDLSENVEFYKIDKLFNINNTTAQINITGFETTQLSSYDEVNALYIVVDAVKTLTLSDNMLFFGNVKEAEIDYEELTDLALRITPELTHTSIGHVNSEYKDDSSIDPSRQYEYYNVNNIYNYLGYWDDELYRFGVVFILNNYTLSPTFNIRGIDNLTTKTVFRDIPVYSKDNARNKIVRNKENFLISYKYKTDNGISNEFITDEHENSKGVVKINYDDLENPLLGDLKTNAIGLNFKIPKDVIEVLRPLVKGLFFVRQKRNKTTMCQTIPILTDKSSHLPAVPLDGDVYAMESLVSKEAHSLVHNFDSRIRNISIDRAEITYQAAICPDYTLDLGYYNLYFTGTEFTLKRTKSKLKNEFFTKTPTLPHYYNTNYEIDQNYEDKEPQEMYVVTIPDATYLVKGRLRNNWFAAVAGDEADPFKVSYIGYDASNLIKKVNGFLPGNTEYVTRGKYGPYIGLENKTSRLPTQLYDIKIPNYTEESINDYIEIRGRSAFPFYAISLRFSLDDIINNAESEDFIEEGKLQIIVNDDEYKVTNIYGGDCFIGNFSFRMCRNFQNPEAPNNEIILDGSLWGKYYNRTEMATGDHNSKIIAGDVYAVRMGHYVTVKMCSNINLSLRSTDPYMPSEVGMTGHKRSFYPYTPITTLGSYKIPESALANSGLNTSLGYLYHVECPDVPAVVYNFLTRVMYSDIAVLNSFRNGYRVFRDLHYQDYTSAHGELVSILEKSGDIFCVFEHATGYLGIQASKLTTDLKNASVFITQGSVLPDTPYFLNSEFGSQWQESVIKTPTCIYGVDTVAKRIWRIALEGSLRLQFKLKTISDFKLQSFLNENITLGEYETVPTIGVRNVKSHYNAFKGDVMFTFYDDVDNIEEKAWNVCFNEAIEKFTTFYSWIPSYSANIDNIFFTFDRDTSKYVSKIYADPSLIKLENKEVKCPRILTNNKYIGELTFQSLSDYPLWESSLRNTADDKKYLSMKYEIIDSPHSSLFTLKDGNKLYATQEVIDNINEECLYKLPVKITIDINYNAANSRNLGLSTREVYTTLVLVTLTYYDNIEDTKFWKHGYAGLMLTDDLEPTKWYGKQHPFEFEFIVAENLLFLKIFDNLQLIANKAKPESFHFEVVGESYTFADDKKNAFWRQEALKHIYQWNNGNIVFNRKYLNLSPALRKEWYRNYYDKSTIFPLYYLRNDTLNEIYDSYQSMTSLTHDYQNMVGTEVVYDKLLNEFKLNIHAPAKCMNLGEEVEIDKNTYEELYHTSNIPVHKKELNDGSFKYYKYINYGRRLGNCHYKEDLWYIQIPPILYAEKNEDWPNETLSLLRDLPQYPQLNVYYSPILEALPKDKAANVKLPKFFNDKYYLMEIYTDEYGIQKERHVLKPKEYDNLPDEERWIPLKWWQFEKWNEKQTRLRDKFIRIKIRYSGEDLAIIYAIKTLYTITYS